MKTIDKLKPVLVTGGTGYMASWIVKILLDDGFTVHTTVRDKSNTNKYQHLLNAEDNGSGNLEVFEADLLVEGAFSEAMKGCELVIHTASPFIIRGLKNADKELIQPALQGTRTLLETVNLVKTVKRVVLTSSVVAMYGDSIDVYRQKGGILTEKMWNTSSTPDHQPYPYSKTIAEKEAWRIEEQQDRWDLVVINPGLIMGPSLSKRIDSTSINLMIELAGGKFKTGVPAGKNACVDVRDVAKAHILAGFTPEASGRHITACCEIDFLDIANIIREKYPKLSLPKGYVPKWLFSLIGPMIGFSRKYVKNNVGYDVAFDNSYIKKDLGIEFIPFKQSIIDHVDQLINDGLIPLK